MIGAAPPTRVRTTQWMQTGRFAIGIAVILSVCLVLATTGFHYSTLHWLSSGMARFAMRPRRRVLSIVFITLMAHIGEIVLYAAAYAVSVDVLRLGDFGGRPVSSELDYLYFSIVTYTSLGLGDVFPGGHLRFIAGIEALNGLLLITWSGSFIYLAMGRLWPWERCVQPKRPDRIPGGAG